MSHIEDRWYRTGPGGVKVPTARHGKGRRWRVRYLDPDGRERGRSFDRSQRASAALGASVGPCGPRDSGCVG